MNSTIAYVTMVKDEEDVIYHHLNYYKNLGVCNFYITDNGSTDSTVDLIYRFGNENPNIKIVLIKDNDLAYWQYKRINRMANMAYENGCKWILPVDVDELLISNSHFHSFDMLKFRFEDWDGDYFKLKWWYYRPYAVYESCSGNPFLEICLRDFPQQSALSKVIVKWKPGMEICQGNHMLHNESSYKEITELSNKFSYAHFNSRSIKHLRKKIQNLGKAYEAIKSEFFHKESLERYQAFKAFGDQYLIECLRDYIKYPRELEFKPFSSEFFRPTTQFEGILGW